MKYKLVSDTQTSIQPNFLRSLISVQPTHSNRSSLVVTFSAN